MPIKSKLEGYGKSGETVVHRLISGRHTAVGDLPIFKARATSILKSVREKRATQKIGKIAIGPPGWLERVRLA
jgi:hypothetical protein